LTDISDSKSYCAKSNALWSSISESTSKISCIGLLSMDMYCCR
jgi:hypothetical protein